MAKGKPFASCNSEMTPEVEANKVSLIINLTEDMGKTVDSK